MASSSPVPSSSPPSSSAIGRRSSPIAALAWLSHTPTTVANNMPPDVDNKPLARQKRRRTSKEDEEILKAEYLKNPKPDKATRLDIVSRVALGEKEVQIWFQNKRQNDRRRSRPLDPSSSASLMSSSSNMSDPPTEEDAIVRHPKIQSPPSEQEEDPKSDDLVPTVATDATADDMPTDSREEEVIEPHESTQADSEASIDSTLAQSTDPHTAETAPTDVSSSEHNLPSSQGASQPRTSWISNRRSASFIRYSEDYATEIISFPNGNAKASESTSPDQRSLKRTHSFVRISTNEDGTARVVTDLDKTPSPPHAKSNPSTFSQAAAGLRRSYSAAGLNERLAAAASGEPSPKIPRTSSNIGRSRDSRAWEFWCDPDSRHNTSLTTRAEQEGSGSAADAIGLIRASRRVLAQNQARQNTPVLSRHASHKALGEKGTKVSKRAFQRAATFNGRLHTKESKKGGDTESDEMPQTESDKENWEPETQTRRPRQTPASQRQRQILGENTDIMSQSSSLGAMMSKEKDKDGGRSSDPEQDEELRSFMNGGGLSGRTSLSSAEEAGCVEGLLKLSQGQWR